MGVIQSSINNLLATATIAARLSPGAVAAGEARNAAMAAKKAEAVESEVFNNKESTPDDITDAQAKAKKLVETAADKAAAAFEANPTDKSFKNMKDAEYKLANRIQNEEDFQKAQYEEKARKEKEKAQKQFDLDTKMAQISKKAETALKWETERVRNSTNFRAYQETLPVKKNNAENRKKEKSGYFEELKVGGNI